MKKWLTGCLGGSASTKRSIYPPSPDLYPPRPYPSTQCTEPPSSLRRPLRGILKKTPSGGLEGSSSSTSGRYRYLPPSRRPRVSLSAHFAPHPSPERRSDFRRRRVDLGPPVLSTRNSQLLSSLRRRQVELRRREAVGELFQELRPRDPFYAQYPYERRLVDFRRHETDRGLSLNRQHSYSAPRLLYASARNPADFWRKSRVGFRTSLRQASGQFSAQTEEERFADFHRFHESLRRIPKRFDQAPFGRHEALLQRHQEPRVQYQPFPRRHKDCVDRGYREPSRRPFHFHMGPTERQGRDLLRYQELHAPRSRRLSLDESHGFAGRVREFGYPDTRRARSVTPVGQSTVPADNSWVTLTPRREHRFLLGEYFDKRFVENGCVPVWRGGHDVRGRDSDSVTSSVQRRVARTIIREEPEKRSILCEEPGKISMLREEPGTGFALRKEQENGPTLREEQENGPTLREEQENRPTLREETGNTPFLREEQGNRTFLREDSRNIPIDVLTIENRSLAPPPVHRRLSFGAGLQDTERKREAFYELLANRYPQYADKITGMAAFHATTAAERNPRPREPQRRRTTAVTYNPHLNRSLDYDDPGTMSDIEPPTFARGGYARASLPIVRSASSSLERPIGLVFLVYRDETKKALLPNEITTLDTVRALFVRAFPEKLSMEFLDSPKRKIYLLEATTSIFFQLEDLRDIQDHSVLKIHECDSEEPQRVKSYPEIRGRAVQPNSASSRPSSRQAYIGEGYRDDMSKAQSLPASSSQMYQELMHKERAQWEMEQEYLHAQHRRSRSRSQTPEPAERPRSLSTGAPRSRYSHSPDRLPTPERGPPHLIPIPENPRMVANGFRESMNGGHYEALAASRSHPHPPSGHLDPPPHPGRGISPTPGGQGIYESVYGSGGYHNPQSYVSHSTRASLPQGPQRATGPPPPDMRRAGPPNRHSLAFAAMSNPIYDSFPQRTQSYRPAPERDVLPPRPQSTNPHEIHRMERMEQQIASLAAWVHQAQSPPSEPVRRGPGSSRSTSSGHSDGTDTYPGSSASSLSDIPTSYSVRNPVVTHDMKEKINDLQCRMQELRVELQGLRRMEQLNQEAMREAFSDTLCKLRTVMGAVPGADNQVIRHQRLEISSLAEAYLKDKTRVEKELSDLERSVDELKEDVLNRKCRINVSDVEGLALMLSNITKTLADQKVRFPQVRDNLKRVMAGEVEIVVKEEKFLKDEPLQIDSALKRCKNLTSTLYTLKRLAAVQDTRPPQIPTVAMESKEVGDHEKMAILESIRAMVPDHDNRLEKLEAADASRERKKKIVTQQESLRFTKTLQTATKSLKPADTQTSSGKAKSDSETDCKKSAAGSEWDNRKTEPPEIPAKPARLMSASEVKKLEAGGGSGHGGSELATSHPLSPVSHTVTVTSQISDSGDKKVTSEDVSSHRSSARSAFFSSMQSPPTSPMSKSDGSKTSSKLPSASKAGGGSSSGPTSSTASSSSSSISPSHSKQASGVYFQALSPTKSRSAFSSIPLPSKPSAAADKDDCADKGRKVPPPPPPRKSSAKYPLGLTSSSLSPNANGGVETSQVRRNSGDRSADTRSKVTSPKSPTASGPLSSSTPKPVTPQKPAMSKFQKDLAAGIYSNLNRPDLQNQKMTPDRLLTTMVSPPPAAVTTNSQDPQDEADLSGSESTGSSTSLDSQQGVALLRSNSSALAANRGPKPHPPQRHSSLSAKGSSSEDSGTKTKTQMLQERVRKSQEAGKSSAFPQVNGLNGAKNGHKT